MNNEVELLIDDDKNKFYVLKNSSLDINNKLLENCGNDTVTLNKKLYYKNKLVHRENGPAIEYYDGDNEWYINGILHRNGGPSIEKTNGYKKWHINGFLHRENGPAIESRYGNRWYINGALHREDGPAVEHYDGTKKYYINGKLISEENFYLEQDLRTNLKNNNLNKKNKI